MTIITTRNTIMIIVPIGTKTATAIVAPELLVSIGMISEE